jgi:curved DNA-binding protein
MNHYATLGLDLRCTPAQIRSAYRLLAKQHHPDLNPDSPEALRRTQELNVAHETLSDPERRKLYDRELSSAKKPASSRTGKLDRNIAQDVHLKIEDFFRGALLEVRVNDPANPGGIEIYELTIPPNTAPGARFSLPRSDPFSGGFVKVRVRVRPSFRFKARGSDLRCDLKINAQRAAQGGLEMITGATGARLLLQIPPRVGRGEILRITGEGLPKPRSGRGDLLVCINYRPEVRISRRSNR